MSYESRPYYTESYTIFVEPIRDPSPDARRFNLDRTHRRPLEKSFLSVLAYGLGAGLVGITATSITQTIEYHITGRQTIRAPGEFIKRFFKHNFGHRDFFHGSRPAPGSGPSRNSNNKSQDKRKNEQNDEEPMYEDEGGSEPSNLTEPPNDDGELSESSHRTKSLAKWATYFGQGAMLGGVRAIFSYYGARGIVSDMVFLSIASPADRCSFWEDMADNAPLSQILLDSVPELIHETVYAFVTGFLCDHWVN